MPPRRSAPSHGASPSQSPTLSHDALWSAADDDRLRSIMHSRKAQQPWDEIAGIAFPDGSRSASQCLERWKLLFRPKSVKGPWSAEEDAFLAQLVEKHGAEKWVQIAKLLGSRSGKQCRERWHNHLDPTSEHLSPCPMSWHSPPDLCRSSQSTRPLFRPTRTSSFSTSTSKWALNGQRWHGTCRAGQSPSADGDRTFG
jgi:hypothetical protein